MKPDTFFDALEPRCLLATFTVANTADSGPGSLRAAIDDANNAGGADVVAFDPSLLGVITLASQLQVSDDLTISGPGASNLTISGNNATGILLIDPGIALTINDVTLADGSASGAGAVTAGGTLIATRVTFANNVGTAAGAVSASATPTFTSCTFIGNSVPGAGVGAIRSTADAIITDCVFTGNAAPSGFAGAAYVSGTLTVDGSTFTNNTGINSGALQTGAAATITDSTFTANSGAASGAVLAMGPAAVSDSTFTLNTTPGAGGAIYTFNTLTVTRTTLSQNNADAGGGAIFGDIATSVTVVDSELFGNTALGAGGAIYACDSLTVRGSTIAANQGQTGGGIFAAAGSTVEVANSTISGNTAFVSAGGGIHLDGSGTLIVESCTIADNVAASTGGGVASLSSFLIRNSIVAGNAGGDLDAVLPLDAASAGNLIGDAASAAGLVDGVDSNIVGADPLLGALANNGGPTRTRSLQTGSPAIDAGVLPTVITYDQRGNGFARVRGTAIDIGALEANVTPMLAALQRSSPSVARGQPIVLTATGALDGDGSIASVRFYLDADNDSVADVGELIATDSDGSNGFSFSFGATLAMSLGTVTFLARSVDNDGAPSTTVGTNVTITNAAPSAGGFSPSAPTVARGQGLTLTLASAADTDGSIAAVRFYFDANNNGIAESGELLGSDTDGSDGRTYTFASTLAMQAGNAVFLARSVDNDGGLSTTVATSVTFSNVSPTMSGLSASASSLARGQAVTFTVLNPSDIDGTIRADFYVDDNGDGVPDAGELIGSDTDASDGLRFTFSSTQALPLGTKTFLAVLFDNDGGHSSAAAATVGFTNVHPSLAGLTTSTSMFAQGDAFTLTPAGGTDADGSIASVQFYLDANADGVADVSELIGTDSDTADGFSYALTPQQSAALATGAMTFLSVAVDNDGAASAPVAAGVTVLFSIRGRHDFQITGTADSTNASRVATVNPNGSVIVFEEGWIAANLQALTGAAPAISDVVIWTDPKDNLVYVAAPTADGLLLFTRNADGAWSLRNLSTETSATSSPIRGLTTFTSTAGVVVLAGLTETGRIVGFQQTLAALPVEHGGGPAFSFIDISADLESQGMTSPTLTSLISYVPAWDAWHLAGVDADGRIQSVWINPNVPDFTKWRVDDLSAITGTPQIAGQLAVTLTPWGGINLTGLDAAGNLLTTWWVPQFGGEWRVNDLTEQFGGARLTSGNVSGYTTPWGGLNYVGIDETGRVTVYWWTPSVPDWNVSSLLPESASNDDIPTGKLTSSSSQAGTLNVYGTGPDGDVFRLSWNPTDAEAGWAAENLTQTASRQ